MLAHVTQMIVRENKARTEFERVQTAHKIVSTVSAIGIYACTY